jgi:hypothetical protein
MTDVNFEALIAAQAEADKESTKAIMESAKSGMLKKAADGDGGCLPDDKTSWDAGSDEPKMAGVVATYECAGSNDGKAAGTQDAIDEKAKGGDDKDKKGGDDKDKGGDKEGDKPPKEGDDKKGDSGDGKKEEKKAVAGKAGERGTAKENEKCDHKKEGMGCIEKFCCAKVTGYTLPDTLKEGKEAMEKGFKDTQTKSEAGAGSCQADDKTEIDMEKVNKAMKGVKITYECSASTMTASLTMAAIAVASFMQ